MTPYSWIPVLKYLDLQDILSLRTVSKGFKNIIYNYGNDLLYSIKETKSWSRLHEIDSLGKYYTNVNMKLLCAVFKSGPLIKYDKDNNIVGYYPPFNVNGRLIPYDKNTKKEYKPINAYCQNIEDFDYSRSDSIEHLFELCNEIFFGEFEKPKDVQDCIEKHCKITLEKMQEKYKNSEFKEEFQINNKQYYENNTKCLYASILNQNKEVYTTNIFSISNKFMGMIYDFSICILYTLDYSIGYDFFRNFKIHNVKPDTKISLLYCDAFGRDSYIISDKAEYDVATQTYSFPDIKDVCFPVFSRSFKIRIDKCYDTYCQCNTEKCTTINKRTDSYSNCKVSIECIIVDRGGSEKWMEFRSSNVIHIPLQKRFLFLYLPNSDDHKIVSKTYEEVGFVPK